MSKVIKGVGKAIKKVVKKVTSSKLGKALLIGATVWVGGAALGAWSLPSSVPFSSSINGAFASGAGSGAQVAAQTATRAAPAGIPSTSVVASPGAAVGAEAAAASGAAGGAAIDAAAKTPGLVEGAMQSAPAQVGEVAATGATEKVVEKGIISKMMSGAGGFVKNNPMASAMLLSGASSVAAPDEIDLLREKQKQDAAFQAQERERINRNLQEVANVDINAPMPDKPLKFLSTNQPIFSNGIVDKQRGV